MPGLGASTVKMALVLGGILLLMPSLSLILVFKTLVAWRDSADAMHRRFMAHTNAIEHVLSNHDMGLRGYVSVSAEETGVFQSDERLQRPRANLPR